MRVMEWHAELLERMLEVREVIKTLREIKRSENMSSQVWQSLLEGIFSITWDLNVVK